MVEALSGIFAGAKRYKMAAGYTAGVYLFLTTPVLVISKKHKERGHVQVE